jgi:phage portal protein BeeE
MRGIFGSLKFGGGDREGKATDISAYSWQSLLGQQAVKSGVSVNIDTSMQVSAVLACTRALAEGIAQLPLKLYSISADGSQTKRRGTAFGK